MTSLPDPNKWHCVYCQEGYPPSYKKRHVASKKHQTNESAAHSKPLPPAKGKGKGKGKGNPKPKAAAIQVPLDPTAGLANSVLKLTISVEQKPKQT